MIFYSSVFFLNHGPAMCPHTLPHLARPTLNGLQPHQHEQVFVSVCAWTKPAGTGVGAVSVDCGGYMWPKTTLNHIHTPTHTVTEKLETRHPALRYEETFFPRRTKKKIPALRARAPHCQTPDYWFPGFPHKSTFVPTGG